MEHDSVGDSERFLALNEFRMGFKASTFRRAYESTKPIMRVRVGRLLIKEPHVANQPRPPLVRTAEESSPAP